MPYTSVSKYVFFDFLSIKNLLFISYFFSFFNFKRKNSTKLILWPNTSYRNMGKHVHIVKIISIGVKVNNSTLIALLKNYFYFVCYCYSNIISILLYLSSFYLYINLKPINSFEFSFAKTLWFFVWKNT